MTVRELTNSQEINECRKMAEGPEKLWWDERGEERCVILGLWDGDKIIGYSAMEVQPQMLFIHQFFIRQDRRRSRAFLHILGAIGRYGERVRAKRLISTLRIDNSAMLRIAQRLGYEIAGCVMTKEVN